MRSVAKGNYLKGRGGVKHALSHVPYLEMRGGDDRNRAQGRRRLFIDATLHGITRSEVRERIKTLDERRMTIHRIVLSPGIDGVDMEHYTRAVMKSLERSKGRSLEYYATEHKNTDHDHTHVVILGDCEGNPVRLNRSHYETIREAGDRYLEKYHQFERYQDKDLHNLMHDGYARDKGDRSFEWLIEDLKSNYTIEEIDGQRADTFARQLALRPKDDGLKIVREDISCSKYSSLDDLLDLEQKLRRGVFDRIEEDQYRELRSWINNKKQYGDDYHERSDESNKIWRVFEEQFRNSYDDVAAAPPKNFNQRLIEGRGRLLEWHER